MLANNKIKSPLSRKATLVTVVVSQWSGRKFDREITKETNERYQSKSDVNRVNKLVVPAEAIARVHKAGNAIRTAVTAMTLPWKDKGPRVSPNASYTKLVSTVRDLIREHDEAADEFAALYPQLVAEAPARMKEAYNPKDFPSVDEIRSKFRVTIDFDTMPDESDFRCDLDPEIEADIRAEIEATASKTETRLQTSTAERITEVVERMATALAEYGTAIPGATKTKKGANRTRSFKDTLVGNVRELAELLPAFNLSNDPALTAITDRITKELCVEEPKQLRENEAAREAVQKSAESILEDVSKFLA
jgi:histone H3/H4